MINRISILGPACYKQEACLETDKNVNLIYGLNGSGKSTLSEYLRNIEHPNYNRCSIVPSLNSEVEEILVYNEAYVNEIFYSSETQKGIFSLSKENSDAKKKIDEATKNLASQIKAQSEHKRVVEQHSSEREKITDLTYSRLWEIKRKYSGGDRVLEYCLDGLKSSKQSLSEYIISLPCPPNKPEDSIENLRDNLQRLSEAKGSPIPTIPLIDFKVTEIESDPIFNEVITGNANSRVAKLIDKLHNSDWVKDGMKYDTDGICPFCQREYTDDIISDLKQYFNADYEKAVESIKNKGLLYGNSVKNIYIADYSQISIISHLWISIKQQIQRLKETAEDNLNVIREKYKNPSHGFTLIDTTPLVADLNTTIAEANNIITNFNRKLASLARERATVKSKFWEILRYEYNPTIVEFQSQQKIFDSQQRELLKKGQEYDNSIKNLKLTIEEQQKRIVNIEEAIDHINSMLVDMGIVDFKIIKYKEEESLYRIVRNGSDFPVFKTLSEGERTIISVLYFIETCKGILNKDRANKKRIIVIDDPVSSLSNMYIFNIGRIIRNVFYPEIKKDTETKQLIAIPKFEQIFIFTHSLYFFYEMTEMLEEKRHLYQALFRVSKNESGSRIDTMRYEHIQSDYHSYWMTIRDSNTHPALIANCMRNIIEYFFNFVEKRDLNNVFNQDKFKDPKYQAFQRYINRESHSLGQNIFDFKEFDYAIFMDALKHVFIETGYSEHYKKMMKIK